MAEQYFTSFIDPIRGISFDTAALLTSSTINALHFPGLTTSEISDSGGGGSRRTSFLLDGIGMCESMTESFCSAMGQDETILINNTNIIQSDISTINNSKLEKKDSITAQKKRRSRKALYDASTDGTSLDKIETVNVIDEQNEPDDVWLFQVSTNGRKSDPTTDNIFSWVHKEFKTNDINASKHRLLCKLEDMSNARTIRSVSCHNFANVQKSDSVKRSSTGQQVYSDSIEKDNEHLNLFRYDSLDDCFNDTFLLQIIADERRLIEKLTQRCSSLDSLDNDTVSSSKPAAIGRMSSPLRSKTPLFNEKGNTRPSSPLRHTIPATNTNENYTNHKTVTAVERSREVSRERERQPLDYTDLEVMAKVQLENLRQAERQGPLSKRFGGSNASLASTSSGTSVSISNRTGNKPPIAPKSTVTRNGTKPNTYRRSNTQTITTNGHDVPVITETKPPVTSKNRVSLLPPNSANNNRTRPPTARPIQPYRGSQTTFNNNNNPKIQPAPSSVQRNGKKSANDFSSTYTSTENGLLNDVSNKPLPAAIGPQRRTILPQSSAEQTASVDMTTTIPRSSSSLSQGRKSGIPTVGNPQRPTTSTLTRPTSSKVIPTSQSSDSMMVTRTIRTQRTIARPQLSSWNEGCY